ncbi:D-2-hydroxyacid dehydrogenase family protein [Caballeronia sp. SEWSISQ10-4 2]|uniref:D-2-hydroxyacid dehydrogenase family protein n=1 Tax=Caballeronia sp. SEWSISQ10-4 2 TaxID=2937438 RepID=UPI002653B030|nr:D-2-hydroxyacid dehydrogenase family protein [Caballeronia sp. SEWSISQ10-4 2]MDN7177090.1 D-2-hydroxyacid dehydrogenase family protein [Caballeronia sp. SEWSISQ10-4 2]
MRDSSELIKIAVLDDYQNVALHMGDWFRLCDRAEITVFNEHISDSRVLIEKLSPFDVLCVMRERTPLPRSIIENLPRLKLIASTGPRNRSIDMAAARERGITVAHTRIAYDSTVELTWGLILASTRHIAAESWSLRNGAWQTKVGKDLHGKTLGILGLGEIGTRVAMIGRAFGMQVIAWSQNLTPEKAVAADVCYVSKDELFRSADVLSIHLVLSDRTRGLVGAEEIALMKPTAHLVNTSRGPIIRETDLIDALARNRIAGAALDVFDEEPLSKAHSYRSLDNVLATPHIGYVSESLYRTFYGDIIDHLDRWLSDSRYSGEDIVP